MKKDQSFGIDLLAESLVKIGNYLEGLSATSGLILDPPSKFHARLEEIRLAEDYSLPFELEDPLISIRVSSYMGLDFLTSVSIPSILSQTYTNWEVILIGDHDPQWSKIEKYIHSLKDNRFRIFNRPYRGPYPADPRQAWLISGAHAFNDATRISSGHWITKLDQDDSWKPHHLSLLLSEAKKNRSEIVYGATSVNFVDHPYRPAETVGEFPPRMGTFALTASIMHGSFKCFEMNESCYLWNEPGDWGLMWRLALGGAKISYVDQVVAEINLKDKPNHGYYEHQYRTLLEALSKAAGSKVANRNFILNKARLKSSFLRGVRYLKKHNF